MQYGRENFLWYSGYVTNSMVCSNTFVSQYASMHNSIKLQ